MGIIGGIIWFVLSLIIGCLIGAASVKFLNKINKKRILEKAKEVLAGERKNEYVDKGKKIEVNKFIIKKENSEDVERHDLLSGNKQVIKKSETKKEDSPGKKVLKKKVDKKKVTRKRVVKDKVVKK